MDLWAGDVGSGSLAGLPVHGLGGGSGGAVDVLWALRWSLPGLQWLDRGLAGLSALYLLWLVLDPVKLALLGIVVIDAVLDFRSRWQNRYGADGD